MMHKYLLGFLLLGPITSYAQATAFEPAVQLVAHAAPAAPANLVVQPNAVRKLTKLKNGAKGHTSSLYFKTQAKVAAILTKSVDEFLAITTSQPTEEAYFQVLDRSMAQLIPLTHMLEDRYEVAAYYDKMLESVGMKSSKGRLNAFVARSKGSLLAQSEVAL